MIAAVPLSALALIVLALFGALGACRAREAKS